MDQMLKPGMVKGIAGNVASGGCAKWELDRREDEPNVDTSFQWVVAVFRWSNRNKGNDYWQVQMIESQSVGISSRCELSSRGPR
jgi:hypothetical protein